MYKWAQMDGNDAKREIARSHKKNTQDVNEDSSVYGWIAGQESGFNHTGATGRRIPQVGKCFPYGGTSSSLRCRAFHDASRPGEEIVKRSL